MKNKKGFTLIELLAVIIILGVLMIIAIPSVTEYISDSRKSGYINTAKEIISGAVTVVNEGKLGIYDTDTTYYINSACIKTENALRSPYGEFDPAYVVVTYDGFGYNYYWMSVDTSGHGIRDLLSEKDLEKDKIVPNLKANDIDVTKKVEDNPKYVIIDENCQKGDPQEVTVKLCNPVNTSIVIEKVGWKPVLTPGEVVQLRIKDLSDFDGCETMIVWERQDGSSSPWIMIDEATDNRYFFTENNRTLNMKASVEVLGYNHRATVYYRQPIN